jgi:hypothetical protein
MMAGDARALQFSNLFEARPLSRIRSKQRFPSHDSRTLRFKKPAQFWREK